MWPEGVRMEWLLERYHCENFSDHITCVICHRKRSITCSTEYPVWCIGWTVRCSLTVTVQCLSGEIRDCRGERNVRYTIHFFSESQCYSKSVNAATPINHIFVITKEKVLWIAMQTAEISSSFDTQLNYSSVFFRSSNILSCICIA